VPAPREDAGDVGAFGDGLEVRALAHVALGARRAEAGLTVNGRLPLREGSLDVRVVSIDDVVARSARLRRVGARAVDEGRLHGVVSFVADRIGVLSSHRRVVGEMQRIVVRADDGIDVVAEVASDAVLRLGERGGVDHPVLVARVNGHGRVAFRAEGADTRREAALVEREKKRIVRRVRVHAAGPLRVLLRVAVLARLGVLELLDGEGRVGTGRPGRLAARDEQRDRSVTKEVHRPTLRRKDCGSW
jgi:hypothetical protein